jgi:hypothetical protein
MMGLIECRDDGMKGRGRPALPRADRTVKRLNVYLTEGEYEKLRQVVSQNGHGSMSVFARLAIGEAAEECGEVVLVTVERRTRERRGAAADHQPERRRADRRRTGRNRP